MAKGPGGIISGGFDPLNAPDAPTIDSVSAGVLTADVTVSAPTDAGQGTITSYVVSAKQGDGTSVSNTASAAGTVSLTLTAGGTTNFAVQAISEYGPGAFSGYGNATAVYTGAEFYSWGTTQYGESGLDISGAANPASSPIQVGALTTWESLTAGYYGVAAVTTSNELFTWGYGGYGANGDGTAVAGRSSPVQVGALTNWKTVSRSQGTTYAVKTDGTLWAFGLNANGQVGDNSRINKSSPIQIGSLDSWSKVAANNGSVFCLAIQTDGTLWSWGDNGYGQLGQNLNYLVDRSSPVQIGTDTDWSVIATSNSAGYAIKTDGTLWSWGSNGSGELGHGDTTARSSPVQIGTDTDWAFIGAGTYAAYAFKTNGELYSWGAGTNGALGHNNVTNYQSPVQVGTLTNWSTGEGGSNYASCIKTDGTLWSWGNNTNGELGQNDTTNKSSPVQIGSDTNWFKVGVGLAHNHALAGVTS